MRRFVIFGILVKAHRTPLSRQAHEGYTIANFKGDILINRKGEWGSNMEPTLTLEDRGRTEDRKKKDENQEEP